MEVRAQRAVDGGRLVRGAYLALDLGLAGDHRVEAGRHLEEVADHVVAGQDDRPRSGPAHRQPLQVLEEQPDLLGGGVGVLGPRVELDAVAGGQDERLTHVRGTEQTRQRLGELLRPDRGSLEVLEGIPVPDRQREQWHHAPPLAAGSAVRTRGSFPLPTPSATVRSATMNVEVRVAVDDSG